MTPAQRKRRAELERAVQSANKDVANARKNLHVAQEMLREHDAWVRKFEKNYGSCSYRQCRAQGTHIARHGVYRGLALCAKHHEGPRLDALVPFQKRRRA